jgi:DNA-binding beta-propeller fold protein YncE
MLTRELLHTTESSILHRPDLEKFPAVAAGARERRATCSGVAWFGGYHLAVVNLYGQHLRIYRYQPADGGGPASLALLQEVAQDIDYPEDVAVSPDGALLAVTHSLTLQHVVSLFALDPVTFRVRPGGTSLRRCQVGQGYHGVNFSPDSRHLVVTEISHPGFIEVLPMGSRTGSRGCFLENRRDPLRPKSVAISPDGKFAAVPLGIGPGLKAPASGPGGVVAVHRFDAQSGLLEAESLVEYQGMGAQLANMDMSVFLPGHDAPYTFLVADTGCDTLACFEFDAARLTLTRAADYTDGLSFPHGVDVSADGRFVAITNYGDDTLCIARVGH